MEQNKKIKNRDVLSSMIVILLCISVIVVILIHMFFTIETTYKISPILVITLSYIAACAYDVLFGANISIRDWEDIIEKSENEREIIKFMIILSALEMNIFWRIALLMYDYGIMKIPTPENRKANEKKN